MGERPSAKHTLERKDNDLGYNASNCKWATRQEQQNNMRRNRYVLVDGQSVTISQAARILKIPYNVAYWWLHYRYIALGRS
jgi:ribosomal protein L28